MPTGLHPIISCNTEKCNGCQVCEYVCSIVKEKTTNWKKSRIRTVRLEPIFNMAIACRKCEKASCQRACPSKAITQREDGIILVEKEKCIGCGWCIEACPFGSMRLHIKNRIAFTCDYCEKDGGPKCVELCPMKALEVMTLDQVGMKSTKDAVKKILQEVIEATEKAGKR